MSITFFLSIAQWTDLIQQGYTQLLNLFRSSIIPSVMGKYNLTSLKNTNEISAILKWRYVDGTMGEDIHALITNIVNVSI